MSGKNVNFGDKKIEKKQFLRKKKNKIHDIDVNKISVPKEEPYALKNSFKYFIGYNGDDAIRPLCIKLPQMIGYVRSSDGNGTMYFKISYSILFKSTIKYGKELKSY